MIIIILIPLGLLIGFNFKILKSGDESDRINFYVGIITYLGTVILGIVAYWQTKSANKISETLSRKQMVCNIKLLGDVEINRLSLNPKRVIEFSSKNETEGLLCTTKELDAISSQDTDDSFWEICLPFRTEDAAIEKISIEELYFNKPFKENEAFKEFYTKFNIVNKRGIVPFSYNPVKDSYILKLILNFDEDILKSLNDNNLFVIDFKMCSESNYGVKSISDYSLNFGKLADADKLLTNKTKSIKIKLTNILIHKGRDKYE